MKINFVFFFILQFLFIFFVAFLVCLKNKKYFDKKSTRCWIERITLHRVLFFCRYFIAKIFFILYNTQSLFLLNYMSGSKFLWWLAWFYFRKIILMWMLLDISHWNHFRVCVWVLKNPRPRPQYNISTRLLIRFKDKFNLGLVPNPNTNFF